MRINNRILLNERSRMLNLKNCMWRTVTALSLVCILAAQVSYANERVSFGDGRVSFVPPAGFKAWTEEQIKTKYIRGNPPQYVFANETGTVTAAITFSPARVAPEQLQEYKEAMEQMLPSVNSTSKCNTVNCCTVTGWLL